MTKARLPAPTVAFVDEYCAHYRSVFTNVRHFEQFTRLELGLLAETKRKSLPRLATTVKADGEGRPPAPPRTVRPDGGVAGSERGLEVGGLRLGVGKPLGFSPAPNLHL
jgi:hypothetical protein